MQKIWTVSFLAAGLLLLAGCPKGNQEYKEGRKAEALDDYDTAIVHYERALKSDPQNADYRVRLVRLRLEGGEYHIKQGQKALADNDLTLALSEFQKAHGIDPSNVAAEQEIRRTLEMMGTAIAKRPDRNVASEQPADETLLAKPPELKPLSREPINLKMTNESKIVFETIAKLAGLSVIFDPDFTSRKVTVELPNVTLDEALDAVALESKAFWKPLTSNIILVAPDQPQKRRDLEDEVVQTFYLRNTLTPQDLTEIVTGLRQLLDLKRLQQVNAQNAIVIRDTPDKIALAAKIIRNIDKPRSEIMLHVQVLEVRRDRLRDLGILPGQSASIAFTPRTSVQPNSSTTSTTTTTTTTTPQITLNNLQHLSSADYSLTLPGASATAMLTDSATRILQDPELRVSDGQMAKLKIGDKVPIATGSFQAGVGVGVGGGAGVVNPLVNTQFQYQDVGVNIDVTPRVHFNDEVSLKLKVEVSSVTGQASIGGIQQPIISQRTVDHEIRLKEGETSVLGGLIQHTETSNLNGWPGLANLPLLKFLFSDNSKEVQDNEVIIAITPTILRLPSVNASDLMTLASGSDTNPRVFHEDSTTTTAPPPAPAAGTTEHPGVEPAQSAPPAMLVFQPATATMAPGDTTTIGLAVQNVKDLYSIPLLLQYDPAVIQVEDVKNGGFLSGGTQEIAVVERVDQQRGQVIVSATRQPNTPGVNGSGTLLGVVVRALAPGTTTLQVAQVNARDSQQRVLPLAAGTLTIQVKK